MAHNEPGFAGSMWGEPRTIDGVELAPLVDNTTAPWSIASLVVTRVPHQPHTPDESPLSTASKVRANRIMRIADAYGIAPKPVAVKVDTADLEKRWIGAPHSDWLALPR